MHNKRDGSSCGTVGSSDTGTLTALLLRRQREAHGLSLADVSKRLGQTSRNAYARYEQNASAPTIDKLQELLSIVTGRDFVLKPA
jgi:transcriptional regulator with XRE-family HTH domain